MSYNLLTLNWNKDMLEVRFDVILIKVSAFTSILRGKVACEASFFIKSPNDVLVLVKLQN